MFFCPRGADAFIAAAGTEAICDPENRGRYADVCVVIVAGFGRRWKATDWAGTPGVGGG